MGSVAAECLYTAYCHGLAAVAKECCSQSSPVKIPFKMFHFTQKNKKDMTLKLQCHLPTPR